MLKAILIAAVGVVALVVVFALMGGNESAGVDGEAAEISADPTAETAPEAESDDTSTGN